jgi:hypothetical protein
MQTRSSRGSGEPVWVIALPSACERLGPDPRRALGPAAIRAASTGRTRDRTRPILQQRQKVLAMAPSTRDPNATSTVWDFLQRDSTLNPIPPVANPCCNRRCSRRGPKPMGAGNATTRFHQNSGWVDRRLATRGARTAGRWYATHRRTNGEC